MSENSSQQDFMYEPDLFARDKVDQHTEEEDLWRCCVDANACTATRTKQRLEGTYVRTNEWWVLKIRSSSCVIATVEFLSISHILYVLIYKLLLLINSLIVKDVNVDKCIHFAFDDPFIRFSVRFAM